MSQFILVVLIWSNYQVISPSITFSDKMSKESCLFLKSNVNQMLFKTEKSFNTKCIEIK